MTYTPTAGQAEALEQMDEWWQSGNPKPYVLHGYAGTGKTTTAKHWCSTRNLPFQPVAPTAKAAALWPATPLSGPGRTVHSLVYGRPSDPLYPMLKEAEELQGDARRDLLKKIRMLRPQYPLQFEVKEGVTAGGLVLVDEALMLTQEMGWDLAALGVRILALGDPGQLSPIGGVATFRKPNIVLDEVMRQTKGSDVALLAEAIRIADASDAMALGRPLRPFFDPSAAADADIVLGATRAGVAAYNRSRVDGRKVPEAGDIVIGMVNVKSRGGSPGQYNGQRFTVLQSKLMAGSRDVWLDLEGLDAPAHWRGEVSVAPFDHPDEIELKRGHWKPVMTWGFAATIHKAQGSGWPHVHLLQDWPRWAAQSSIAETRRLLYTAVSRASERISTG